MNDQNRYVILLLVGALTSIFVLCAIFYIGPVSKLMFRPVESVADELSDVLQANNEIVSYYQHAGRLPNDAVGLKALRKFPAARDRQMEYVRMAEFEYMIVSHGRDEKAGTLDDIECIFDIRESPNDFRLD
ncbi:hypothetical protein AB1K70_01635 [Bremerella sp. JC770]|uniref:hypothetical protein n=1 Tax=Bremerella sp. JC770 TaxID=3232137 RepID=UPI00345A4CCF